MIPQIRKQPYGRRTTWSVGGVEYDFPSLLEARWASYLQFQVDTKFILEWNYQPVTWDFRDEMRADGILNGPKQYTPDFLVVDNEGRWVYHETRSRGNLDTKCISRMTRAAKYFDAKFWLVLDSIPRPGTKKHGISARAIGKAYIERIVDAGKIFRQTKGLVRYP